MMRKNERRKKMREWRDDKMSGWTVDAEKWNVVGRA
jgi:hypothetical protein